MKTRISTERYLFPFFAKKTIIVVLLIFSGLFSQAQIDYLTPEQWLTEHKKEIKSTSYIFEGTVTQKKIYYGTTQAVYTSIIQVTKIYKGSPQLKLGSIKLVTEQYIVSNGFVSIPSDGGLLPIDKGGTYIIFAKDADSSWLVDSTVTDNSILLTRWGMDNAIAVNPKNDSVNWFGTPQFKTVNDIEGFFKANGVTVQEEAPTGGVK